MALLTINHYVNQVNNFINSIANRSHAYYLFAARANTWPNGDVSNNVPVANNSVAQYQQSIYSDLLFGKLITANSVSYVIPRYDWTTGTVYNSYSPTDANLYNENFYVKNSNYQVYKCIYNNNGVPSTVEPTLTNTQGVFQTGDGYIWKYMYTISSTANSFTSSNFIPVSTDANVSSNAVSGTIDAMIVTNGGNNYQIYETNNIVNVISNTIIQIPTNVASDNYYVNSSIYLSAGYGAGQVRQIVASSASQKTVSVSPSTPFKIFTILNVSNPLGTITPGYTAYQNIDNLSYLYSIGYFNVGSNVFQTDTGSGGVVATANTTALQIFRSTTTTFSQSPSYPIFDVSQIGVQKPGNVTISVACNQVVSVNGTQFTDTANGYSVGDYIRVGSANTQQNIRRVTSVNTTVVVVDNPFLNAVVANNHYKMTTAAEPQSIGYANVSGSITNTNLTSVSLIINNPSIGGSVFIVGEQVDLVNSSNVTIGANGTVAYSNTSTVVLAQVSGSSYWTNPTYWNTSYFVRGNSSGITYNPVSSSSTPNITIGNLTGGSFVVGQPVFISLNNANTGNATIISTTTIPNNLTQYTIGPSIVVDGDGTNVVAIGIVNQINNANTLSGVQIINPGQNYTFANVSVVCNSTYGSGATVNPIIAPIFGHGYDSITELGGRYAAINMTFDTASNDSYYYPSYGTYRKIGIIQDPSYSDVRVTLTNFSRVNLAISGAVPTTGPWANGEVVIQPATNAYGTVVYGNGSFLQLANVGGPGTAPYFANTGNTSIFGYSSNTTATVSTANVIYFSLGGNAGIISEVTSGATGNISQIISNTNIELYNVKGQFDANDVMYDSVTNAYATISTIYTANGTKNQTQTFGQKFNQTMRLTLTSNVGAYQQFEYVQQSITGANAYVISTNNEIDLVITTGNTFTNSSVLESATGNGIISFANNNYIKLTDVVGTFSIGQTINSGSVSASISNIYPVLLMNNVNGNNAFQAGQNTIIGQTSGASGICIDPTLLTFPELVRNSGKVIYLNNMLPVTRSTSTSEQFNIVIQF
jgi:hypothetical protein